MRRNTIVLLIIALMTGACGARGTGGLSVDDPADRRAVLAAAPNATRDAGTAHISLLMELQGPGIPEGTTVLGTGQQDFDAGQLFITMDVSAIPGMPEPGSMTYVITPDATYMAISSLEQQLGVKWVRMRYSDLTDEFGVDFEEMMSGQAVDPTAALDQLYGVSDDVEVVGEELVRGVETTHFRATIDRAAAVELAPESRRRALENLMADSGLGDSWTVEVWIDNDGRVRRQLMTMPVGGIEQRITMEAFDFGQPVDIQIPVDSIIDLPDFMEQMQPSGATSQIPG